ncbi:uncharacterized protein K441DRAFT_188183 [Cenococcum geophilum 1.58]|uniref:uncharacterized protein n=1 Tax=Cenococcum geophilum 1.58 TaxID=794803 RepID=UPI00358F2E98|nr:hypothetical protein K441DRAFT_188183 [Cenococcum geophilum 1.58]
MSILTYDEQTKSSFLTTLSASFWIIFYVHNTQSGGVMYSTSKLSTQPSCLLYSKDLTNSESL